MSTPCTKITNNKTPLALIHSMAALGRCDGTCGAQGSLYGVRNMIIALRESVVVKCALSQLGKLLFCWFWFFFP